MGRPTDDDDDDDRRGTGNRREVVRVDRTGDPTELATRPVGKGSRPVPKSCGSIGSD
jgi:hypothetical protein